MMDSTLDRYLWEAAAAVVKQEDEEDWDLQWEPFIKTEQQEPFMMDELVSLPSPTMDGLVPEVELVEYCMLQEESPIQLKVEEEAQDWDWEEENGSKPILLEDTFIGWTNKREEQDLEEDPLPWLPWERPRSVAFVGAEGSRISSHNHLSNSFHLLPTTSSHHNHLNGHPPPNHDFQSTWPQEHFHSNQFNDYHPNSTSSGYYYEGHYETLSSPTNGFAQSGTLQPNEFEELLNISESSQGPSHHFIPHSQAQQDTQAPTFYEPISAPQSIYSSASDSSWNGQDSYTSGSQDSSLSQDEIFEQIQRECAEIEERHSSASPPSQPSTSKRTTRKTQRKEPQLKMIAKKTPIKASLSPQSGADSPMTGEKKKELNRIAATKYREKKRLEREAASSELKTLEGRNTQLKTECSAMETEIKYLKGLIKEIESRTSSTAR